MNNSQTIPAQAISNKSMTGQAFRRAREMQAAIMQAMQLVGMMRENALRAIGAYESRGKGKGKPARRAAKPGRRSFGKVYPQQSTRQDRPKYYTATVNGFQIMQRLSRDLSGF